jgi:hypothetical protein
MAFPLLGTPKPQFSDSSGSPYANGTLAILDPADDTNKASYPTADDADAATNANINPVVLDSRGGPPNGLFGIDGEDYKLTLKDEDGTTIWTVDDVILASGTRATIGSILYPQTADETTAGVTVVNFFKPPMYPLRYGTNTTPGTTEMATAIQAAIDVAEVNGGEVVFDEPGDYKVSTTLTVTARDVKIRGTSGVKIQWTGATTSSCLELGDGTSLVIGVVIDTIEIEDTTAGTGGTTHGVVHIHACRRSRFYNLRIFGDTLKTQGTGLFIEDAWNNDFFGLKLKNLNNGIEFGADSNGTNGTSFHGIQVETYNNAGVLFSATSQTSLISFFGGVLEGGAPQNANAVSILRKQNGVNFFGTYFENNEYDIEIDNTGGSANPINVQGCSFITGTAGLPAIRHDGGNNYLMVGGCNFGNRDAIQIDVSNARYLGTLNQISNTDKLEVVGSAITGITQANPAVVTSTAHGFANGDVIFIVGVTGMTEVNGRSFTVANKADDTYELTGEDSTGHGAYTTTSASRSAFHAEFVHYWRITGDGYLQLQGGFGIKKDNNFIPSIQTGTDGTLAATSNEAVTFSTAFSKTPRVFVTVIDATEGQISVTGVTKTGFTVYNPGATPIGYYWMAIETS